MAEQLDTVWAAPCGESASYVVTCRGASRFGLYRCTLLLAKLWSTLKNFTFSLKHEHQLRLYSIRNEYYLGGINRRKKKHDCKLYMSIFSKSSGSFDRYHNLFYVWCLMFDVCLFFVCSDWPIWNFLKINMFDK